MNIMTNTQNEVKYTRITFVNLFVSETNTVEIVTNVDISGLLFSTTSYSILLISLNVLLKLTSIKSIRSVMYTAKFEPWTSCLYVTTLSDNDKPLR